MLAGGGIVEVWPLVRIRAEQTLVEAAETMCRRSIGALGVNDGSGTLMGIFTERDLAWIVAQGRHPAGVTAGEAVNDFPLIVDAPITRAAAAEMMLTAHVRHLVIRDGGEYGIVSMRDLLRDAYEHTEPKS